MFIFISLISAKGPTLQPPGSFIPLDLHHLLKQDFVEFEVDEYVGYELDDPEMYNQSGDATYIYATIIEKLPVSWWWQVKSVIYSGWNRWQAIHPFRPPQTRTINVFPLSFSPHYHFCWHQNLHQNYLVLECPVTSSTIVQKHSVELH